MKSKGANVRMVTLYEVLYMFSRSVVTSLDFENEGSKRRFQKEVLVKILLNSFTRSR